MKSKLLLVLGVVALFMTSCQTYRHTMREPNNHVEFYASDFELSEPVTAEATVTRVLCIDWERTFGTKKAGFANNGSELPIIGNMIYGGANIALYKLLKANPGYDVIFYPQVEEHKSAPIFGTDIYSTTTYKVTARLGKLKKK
ncbi:MAG: hypothetical protein J6X79_06540 [Bacteroidales bacterium]|nr:hypothetical protein [Bacteroidales bacterium]